jgi:hypothetical protein
MNHLTTRKATEADWDAMWDLLDARDEKQTLK